MPEFKREHDRYIVVKTKDMTASQLKALTGLLELNNIPTRGSIGRVDSWLPHHACNP